MKNEHDSDPLPFTQLDRAAKAVAARLASAKKVSNQHALGALVEFWDLCGDPRELERIAQQTPEGQEPEVRLERDDLALRFELAFGQPVEVRLLSLLGLVELDPEGKRDRVRGMSRYFSAILPRLQARDAASKGGKASVAARRAKHGSAQPRANDRGAGSQAVQSVVEAPTEATPEAPPKRPRSGLRSATEAAPNQRTEGRGQISTEDLSPTTEEITAAQPGSKHPSSSFFEAFQRVRHERTGITPERPDVPALLEWWASASQLVGGDVVALEAGVSRYFADPYWAARGSPWNGWATQWTRHVTKRRLRIEDSPRTDAQREWASRLEHVDEYYLVPLREFRAEHLDGRLVVKTDDPFLARWCREACPAVFEGIEVVAPPLPSPAQFQEAAQ